MITWGTVIDIILETFDKSQIEFTKAIHGNKSSTSRIISGKSNPSFTKEKLYESIFSFNTPTSFACELGSEQFVLDMLKETISQNFEEVRKAMADCWNNGNYKEFVNILLSRARRGASSKRKVQHSIETPTTSKDVLTFCPVRNPKHTNLSKMQPSSPKHTETLTASASPYNGIIGIFSQSIKEFPINVFIECNPSDSLSQSVLCDAISFWGKMNCQQTQEIDPDRATEIYNHIVAFLRVLENYIDFLRYHSINPEAFPDGFQLANCDCEDLDGEINRYQRQLKSLFEIAASETEIEVSNRLKRQLDAQKKAGVYERLPKS